MNRDQKAVQVDELQRKLSEARAFYLTDFTGMSVKQITEFRSRLRNNGVDYVVVKNTLAQRALTAMEMPEFTGFFTGPTGVVIGREDAVTAAKVLTDFAKEFDNRPAVKAGVVERKAVVPRRRPASAHVALGGRNEPDDGRLCPGLGRASATARGRCVLTGVVFLLGRHGVRGRLAVCRTAI
jgi:ribosomal protein L10